MSKLSRHREKVKVTPKTVGGYLILLTVVYFGIYGALHLTAAAMS